MSVQCTMIMTAVIMNIATLSTVSARLASRYVSAPWQKAIAADMNAIIAGAAVGDNGIGGVNRGSLGRMDDLLRFFRRHGIGGWMSTGGRHEHKDQQSQVPALRHYLRLPLPARAPESAGALRLRQVREGVQ